MKVFSDTYRGRRVLLSGNTGFRGSLLALWLRELGANVSGVAQPPAATPNHWGPLRLDIADHYLDLRQLTAQLVTSLQREIVIHLAAQSLVRRSYRDPPETWSTNVMGTANLLDACRQTLGVRAIVVVTTDKRYEYHDAEWSYRETDRLGGHDPYSASKAAATRPWQLVLESLTGNLLRGQKLLDGDCGFVEVWNFEPASDDNRTVAAVLTRMTEFWPKLAWEATWQPQPHEAHLLYLDSTKAKPRLGWEPVWPLDRALRATADWYRGLFETGRVESRMQLAQYVADARAAGAAWSQE